MTKKNQYGDVEELVLSGKLFNTTSASPSPSRSQSPSSIHRRADYQWPEINSDFESSEEKGLVDSNDDQDVLDELEDTSNYPKVSKTTNVVRESIGMGPGRTGVKGVIRDRKEMNTIERERQRVKLKETNERMERMNLGGMTYLEEKAFDEAKEAEDDNSWEERRKTRMEFRSGKFGHLREIGVSNFVGAIENEAPNVWVVVHLYDRVRSLSNPPPN